MLRHRLQPLEQGGIAVGRLNKDLGLAGAHGQAFEFAQACFALACILRQVTHEGKVLSVQTAGRQRQHEGDGPGQGGHRQAQFVRGPHH
jgi:hypothetical protein